MNNVHGLGDLPQNQGNAGRAPLGGLAGMQGPNEPLLQKEIRQSRVPFMDTMKSDRHPLDETIPYTLKIVWCPSIKLISLSVALTIAIWVMYIVCLSQGISDDMKSGVLAPLPMTLRKYGALSYFLIKDGEVWRLITAGFLHVDLLHITTNSFSLLFLFTRLEAIYHPLIIFAFMLCSLISGNIMSVTLNSHDIMSCGASTILYGVYGAFIAYMLINWKVLGSIRSQLCCLIGIILFFSIVFSLGERVDFSGHMGGLIGGFLCGVAMFPGIEEKNKFYTLAGCGALAAYFLTMFLVFFLTD